MWVQKIVINTVRMGNFTRPTSKVVCCDVVDVVTRVLYFGKFFSTLSAKIRSHNHSMGFL